MSKWRRHSHQKARRLRVTRLMARDGASCGICGGALDRSIADEFSSEYITFDHVTPLSKGGRDSFENIRLAHRRCNEARGNGEAQSHSHATVPGEGGRDAP